MTRPGRKPTVVVLIAGAVLAADQLTKALVRAYLPPGASFPADWPVRLTHVTNTGAAFGLFTNQSLVLTFVAFFAIGLIVYYYRKMPDGAWPLRVALGLQLGGAAGNLIDRLRQGYVTDFIDLRFWPVFNIADSAITVGAVLLAASLLWPDLTKSRSPADHAAAPAGDRQRDA